VWYSRPLLWQMCVSSGLVAPYRLFPRFLLWTLTFSTTAFFVALTDERIELVLYLLTRSDFPVQGRSYRFAYHLESFSLAFMMPVRSWVNFGAGSAFLSGVEPQRPAPHAPGQWKRPAVRISMPSRKSSTPHQPLLMLSAPALLSNALAMALRLRVSSEYRYAQSATRTHSLDLRAQEGFSAKARAAAFTEEPQCTA
jgi:hypothetical protein